MSRIWRAATKDYGQQVPSGWSLRGWIFWGAAAVLLLIGIVVLTDHHVLVGCILVAFAVALVAHTFTDLTY